MNYLSVCSGVEAATVAWHGLGWNPLAFSEIEKFPSEVLAHHYPTVPNLGDMTKYKEWNFGTDRLDLLVGGTPCQSFSVAGLRKGLDDPRGNLALVYCGILDKFRPKWFVWENVPGVLSSSGGRDFGAFLGALVELGYGFSYRVLDAQYFGVAQRRRRVFVVGSARDWRDTAKVLFESDCLRGDIKKSRNKGQEVARCLTTGIGSRYDGETDTFVTKVYENHPTDSRVKEIKTSPTVTARWGTGGGNVPYVQNVAYSFDSLASNSMKSKNPNSGCREVELSKTLDTTNPCPSKNQGGIGIMQNMAVRRLTPIECERLQGFPDDYTNIKEKCPDGPRYKAMGNSMAVPVMRWIGKRIQMVEDGLL
jgi:DNA (cytosine-5)-methyltransferase 1